MKLEVIEELVVELENAVTSVIQDLKKNYDEEFYYFSLILSDATTCPYLVAWSKEALERAVDGEEDSEEEKSMLKWSYADSPYYAYGKEFYTKVEEIIYEKREHLMAFDLSDEDFEQELILRLNSMEQVMINLDEKGMFGTGDERLYVVVNAEIMPPEYSNTERALRLNPMESLKEWLIEAAEEDEDEDDFEDEDYDDDDFEDEDFDIEE